MSEQFFCYRLIDNWTQAEAAIAQIENPFCTLNYAQAMQRLGCECWVIGIRLNDWVSDAAIALVRHGRLSCELEVVSLPAAGEKALFRDGLYTLAKQLKVTDLILDTFASPRITVPALPGETSRESRTEYVITLDQDDLIANLSSNHKRNIKKARSAGVTVRTALDSASSISDHARLINNSLSRRSNRGESISTSAQDTKICRAYLECGAAELFQAVHNGQVVSSVLVLLSDRSAYYQSAGTSPEGMAVGASHFLIFAICEDLKCRGFQTFNLGGAPEGSSLGRFKSGFGALEVGLSSCRCYIGPLWRKKVRSILRLASTHPAHFKRILFGYFYRILVYQLPTGVPMPQITTPLKSVQFRELHKSDLLSLPDNSSTSQFRQQQLDRFARCPEARIFGVYVQGKLAHVSWLLHPQAVNLERPRILTLQPDEAEVTGCETLPEFRGNGLYSFAIQQIFRIAPQAGIRTIYMKTQYNNKSSQSGIRKAGLQMVRLVTIITPPAFPNKTYVLSRVLTKKSRKDSLC